MSTLSGVSATARLLQSHRAGAEPLRVLSASGQLGYGIPQASFERGMARHPHVIGCDMGSIDPGPYYLGSGQMAAPETMVLRDLELVLLAALKAGVPLIIGSAGTAGSRPQLDATVTLVQQIAARHGLSFRLATIASDVAAADVVAALRAGRLRTLGADGVGSPLPLPTEAEVLSCTHIVGQCGTEIFKRALQTLPDVVIAGRACDTAIFASLPEMLGYPPALCLHMAKIIECTSLCCRPGAATPCLPN
ncbi:acyclic terpene utilization AtuA family protein [Polaromonas sp. P1(28)-13]|nr:acyclic terpene utilization AtuA family protein [Polaromonas sp. P1(28)-13]